MSDAHKCNRCGVLFESEPGQLVILDLHERISHQTERSIYTESENECDLCSGCSAGLRAFLGLKPSPRQAVKSHSSKGGENGE